jgi:hypothetical protein
MDFRFRGKSGRAADMTVMTESDQSGHHGKVRVYPNSTCRSNQKLWSNGNIGSVDYASLCFLEHRIDSF